MHSSFIVFSVIIAFKQTQTVPLTAFNFSLYYNFTTTLLLRRFLIFEQNDDHFEQSVEDEEHYHPFQKRFTASVSDESLHAAMTLVGEDFRADLKQAVEEEQQETSETLEEIRNKKQRTSSFFNDPNNVPRAR